MRRIQVKFFAFFYLSGLPFLAVGEAESAVSVKVDGKPDIGAVQEVRNVVALGHVD